MKLDSDHTCYNSGKYYEKCNRLNSGPLGGPPTPKWEEVTKLSQGNLGMAGVALNSEWLFFSGGSKKGALGIVETFLLNSSGKKIQLPNLRLARSYACASIIGDEDGQKVVAVIGGMDAKANRLKSMERYSCSTQGDTPTCTKMSNGPDLIIGSDFPNCITLQTRKVSDIKKN